MQHSCTSIASANINTVNHSESYIKCSITALSSYTCMCLCVQNACVLYPEKRVKRSIFHELCDDHRRSALGDHALQSDDVWLIKLAHDWRLGQEVPPLPLRVANLQGLDGHRNFFFPNRLQATFVHLPKLAWKRRSLKFKGYSIHLRLFRKHYETQQGKTSAFLGMVVFLMLLRIQSP